MLVMPGLPPMKKTSRVQDGAAVPLPPDPRVQETNQASRCFRTFMDFLDCRHYLSEENYNCAFLKETYNRICPSFWTEQWYEQLKKGTHPAWEEPPPPKICDVCPKEE
ncbi:uncharacterized protein LOC113207768 [Frankliniella occidentalis]|uniref:Uncharacterized protein LOC113207768 n=1 Tax=Frankliniella occidentalis TaxID=133901 RepID=A0A9C6XU18_FRAOC|nr:uncharacterized protein LOC113207768 [Frankliniella occidentalis]